MFGFLIIVTEINFEFIRKTQITKSKKKHTESFRLENATTVSISLNHDAAD